MQQHEPVLLSEVLSNLNLSSGSRVLDATVGSGGHSEAILKMIGPSGFLVALDRDQAALKRTQVRLKDFEGQYTLKHARFSELDIILAQLHMKDFDAVLLDIGTSSEQMNDPQRGFAFKHNGPLDMRMDQGRDLVSAKTLVNEAEEEELATIFWEFGEERHARRIASAVVQMREEKPIETTGDLNALIESLPFFRRSYYRIHPATRVFQALRIAVNRELDELREALPKALSCLKIGGRCAVISFHSLEDRMVKYFFRAKKENGTVRAITKKPIRPSRDEALRNPRSRSAKMRVVERIL